MSFRQILFLWTLVPVSFPVYAEIPASCADFGTGISVSPYTDKNDNQIDLSGDFNGDGITDQLLILTISQDSKISSDVKTCNPLTKQQKKVVLPDEPTFAIGLVEGSAKEKECKKILIYDKDFFTSPSANLKLYEHFFVEVIRADRPEFTIWKDLVKDKDFNNDAFFVDGRLGGLVVYWRKGTCKTFLYELGDG